jgi:hypothetical protein
MAAGEPAIGRYKEEGTGWWKHRGKRSSREPPNDAANSSRAQSGESAGPSPRQCIDSLKTHVLSFVTTHNFAKHLKARKWKTPFQMQLHEFRMFFAV